ncbi:HAD family hydrolase [Sporolactobacillus sp. CQH2019]|uniref:HAD family hydrolase n=1 Tax=Sporolactobacillus sp. CQH2019 TaxID=3023512 RepID=UPI00236815A4|nr:HAD family hydrolase [Sporolactobacillus sp. CQH2019]MDD9147769.1 HAD family hydrolase [Sporolactobacillus sp. CQH2019]
MITHVIWDLGDTINTSPHEGLDRKPLYEYPEVQLRLHVKETLFRLEQMGLKQAVLSNTAYSDSEMAGKMLEKLGVGHYFTFVYATQSELEEGKPQKPDPEVFDFMIRKLQIHRSEAVMIGNSWDNDILGANESGIHAIWLTNQEIAVRRNVTKKVQTPPWIIPVHDVGNIPDALGLLMQLP